MLASMRSAPSHRTSTPGAGRVAIAGGAVLFGTSATATRLVDGMPDALTLAAWRQLLGGLALVAVSVAIGQAAWRYRWRPGPTIVGGLAVVAFQAGFFAAVERLGVATATMVVIGTGPVVAGLLDRLLDGTRATGRRCGGIAVAIAGIAVMGGGGQRFAVADCLLAVAAGACFPVYGAATRALMSDRPPSAAIATVFGAGVVPAAALAAIAAGGAGSASAASGPPGAAVVAVALVLAYLGLVTTATAYLLWGYGLARVALGETVAITMLEPVAAFVLAAVVLHEPLGGTRVAGALAVLAGIHLASSKARVAPARSGRGAGGDVVDVAHRPVRRDRGQQHEDRADREHDALVAEPVADLAEAGVVDVAERPLQDVPEQ